MIRKRADGIFDGLRFYISHVAMLHRKEAAKIVIGERSIDNIFSSRCLALIRSCFVSSHDRIRSRTASSFALGARTCVRRFACFCGMAFPHRLLSSPDETTEAVNTLWFKKSEDRIEAYESGRIKAVSLDEGLAEYR